MLIPQCCILCRLHVPEQGCYASNVNPAQPAVGRLREQVSNRLWGTIIRKVLDSSSRHVRGPLRHPFNSR